MKKLFIFVFVCLSAVLLCSCGSVPDRLTLAKVLKEPYEAKIAVSDNGDVYAASISYDGNTLSLSFSEPELLCGISYGFSEDQSRVVYKDLSIPVDLSAMRDRISGGVLVWKDLLEANGEYTVRRAGDGQKKQYIMTDGKAEYRFDADTNTPAYIKSGDITITFTDFRAKNDQTS